MHPQRNPFDQTKAPDETWLDHLIMLLHVAAGIEHELMVQYLYAAYSLGGDDVPPEDEKMVETWRRNLLAIAKEEMGHLLTVQNILTVLGGSITWARGNHPRDDQYFPVRKLEFSPLTLDSLAVYLYAEAPADAADVANKYYGIPTKEVDRIVEKVRKQFVHETPERVGQLYGDIITLVKNEERIPDSAFHAESFASQASWDEWGKGYKPFVLDPQAPAASDPLAAHAHAHATAHAVEHGARPASPDSSKLMEHPPTAVQARVIVSQLASRTHVLDALQLISEQGEDPHQTPRDTQPSHFDRFIHIYEAYEKLEHSQGSEKLTWSPARDVPTNPTTYRGKAGCTYIESEHSRNWAHLFNLRYRMLLMYLSHMYRLPPSSDPGEPEMRPGTLHRVFSEMYNLRSIAGILVRLPLMDEKKHPHDPRRAGPPFELPYTLALPAGDDDCWRLHRELLETSVTLCGELQKQGGAPGDGEQYLAALLALDRQSIAWINTVLEGGSARRSRA